MCTAQWGRVDGEPQGLDTFMDALNSCGFIRQAFSSLTSPARATIRTNYPLRCAILLAVLQTAHK